jgi:putative endonuclease
MAFHNILGNTGERLAVQFLINKQYQILETNYRYLKAEIDIIAMVHNQLVFIEVKTRSETKYGLPQEAVSKKKQNLLIEAAHYYITHHKILAEARFDVIAIIKNKDAASITHIEDAFYPQAE